MCATTVSVLALLRLRSDDTSTVHHHRPPTNRGTLPERRFSGPFESPAPPEPATQENPEEKMVAARHRNKEKYTGGNNDDTAIRGGFSMADAMAHAKLTAAESFARTPSDVLNELQRGNTRFWMGQARRPEVSAFERRALIMRQHPSVAILGCSDSRVPIEIVFDQGLGDVFVIRVAGNCLDTATVGSLEYAALHLNVKCILVMGHEGCGAIAAARLPIEKLSQEPASLSHLLLSLKAGLDEKRLLQVHDKRSWLVHVYPVPLLRVFPCVKS